MPPEQGTVYCFLQVLGGEQHRGAGLDELADGLPQLVVAAWVKAAAGFAQDSTWGG